MFKLNYFFLLFYISVQQKDLRPSRPRPADAAQSQEDQQPFRRGRIGAGGGVWQRRRSADRQVGELVHGLLTARGAGADDAEVQGLLGPRSPRLHGVQRRPAQEGHEHASLAVHCMQNLSHGKKHCHFSFRNPSFTNT